MCSSWVPYTCRDAEQTSEPMAESQPGIQAIDLARVLGCVSCHPATG